MHPTIRPGQILLKEYLEPMGISQNAMARAIGVAPRAINEIVLGKRAITPRMSIRFGAFFEQSETFWHSIQVDYDFQTLREDVRILTRHVQTAKSLLNRQVVKKRDLDHEETAGALPSHLL